MNNVIKVNGVTKRYRGFTALNNVYMSIPKGSIYGFVGKNGAGKTTLIRIICGLQRPTEGDYEILGTSNESKDILKIRRKMGAIVESPAVYPDLSAVDNMKQQYLNLGLPSYEGIDDILKLVGLENTGRKKARNFSLGMRQRLGIAIALCGHPDFLILDEPINGLDPQGIIEMREMILKLNREKGVTILISSHILDELSKLATHYGFIDQGRVIKEMTAKELEEACRKSTRLKVNDSKLLSITLERLGYNYTIIDDNTADVYTSFNFSELAIECSKNGCNIVSAEEHDEDLEGFFMSLVGGEKVG
ncbi:MAG: ATP-binding cassette domain-containing protein [Clostridia bacterium]|nr:ATP-binding cassette domain-containing protein [Clostridia bacterium]